MLNMNDEVRVTVAVATLLRIFLDRPNEPRYGYELMKLTGYPSGKLYPILARLEAAGWLLKERENIDPAAEGRPVRFLYRLSERGTVAARQELATLHQQLAPGGRFRGLRVRGGEA
jgi:PadR family transcriptional regulator, regulatory protein PadR